MQTLWVDTDIALGNKAGDVDDGFALAAVIRAAQKGRVKLRGASATHGNTDTTTAFDCAARLLTVAGFDLPVTPAAEAAAAIAALPQGAHLLCLGPLTNLAAALKLAPDLPQCITVSVVTGIARLWPRVWLPLMDLNQKRDRAAWQEVCTANFTLKQFPLDVVQALRFGPAELAECATTGALGKYLAEHSQRWLRVARGRHLEPRFPVWDLVAALDAVGALADARWHEQKLSGFDANTARDGFLHLLKN